MIRLFVPIPMSSLFLFLFLSLVACTGENPVNEPSPSDEPLTVTVHWSAARQEIRGFGASDAWSTQFVGKNWPLEKREQIADLLFGRTFDENGHPDGIGLSIWRFSIGAGSAEQGDNSGIRDPWRRAEGFLNADHTYDWSRQAGQQWFLRAAKERGVSTLVGFVNSPPVSLTRNGRAYGDGGTHANLSPDRYDTYATFLTNVLSHFESEGLPFDYISPVNEPQWDWAQGNNQEGSPYQNDEIVGLVRALSRKLDQSGLTTEIEIPEAAKINYLYASETDRGGRDDQLVAFFGADGARLQDLPNVAHKAAAHSYFTTWPVADMIRQRQELARAVRATGMEYWMSEYCLLEDNPEVKGGGRDLGIDPALYIARLIHYDLTIAEAASWQWWLAVSPYDYKDGLVYIDRDFQDGRVYESKMLWGLGNYSLFLQPGAERVDLSRTDAASDLEMANGLMVSSYRSANEEKVVVVAVNYAETDGSLRLHVDGLPGGKNVKSWQPYVTSATQNLAPGPAQSPDSVLHVPARSIVTFVGSL